MFVLEGSRQSKAFLLTLHLDLRRSSSSRTDCQNSDGLCYAVSAVEQLQAMAAKRQYKEAAGQLEVGHRGYEIFILSSVL